MDLSRRNFLKLGAAAGVGSVVGAPGSLKAEELEPGGKGFSHTSRKPLEAIPSSCWQCVTRDAIIGYVEDGRLKKIEGNPKSQRTRGKLCAKGQAGVNQVYDPDRLLYPVKRVGKRGEGKWKRLTWDEALTELSARLKTLHDAGTPEKFVFHYGRMKASSGTIIKKYFLPAYGTKSIGNHTSICEAAKWTGQELTWGKHYDVNDITNTNFILNFGCNMLEAHTSHIPFAQRVAEATGRGVPMVTFDVRLSNTAAKSREWVPIKPGTDLAVMLAMASVILSEGLHKPEFIEKFSNVTIAELKTHLAQYTPEWAEKISTVPAAKIKSLAIELAKANPGTVVTYRGVAAHHNGVEGERAAMLLEALCGTIDKPGGRCLAVGAKWKNSYKKSKAKTTKGLKIFDGEGLAYPTHHANHLVLEMIRKKGPGTVDTYMTYCYNPAYVNGNCQENIDILKDESLIPYLVAVDVSLTEIAELADLVLPDATYLERWDWESHASYDQIAEHYIRQPLVKPLGESRDFKDVVCDLGQRLGGDIAKTMSFGTAEAFVKDACDNTPGIKEAGGFEFMKKAGVWVDPSAKPRYESYAKELSGEALKDTVVDEKTGVVWNPGKAKVSDEDVKAKGYTKSKKSYKGYVGQKIGDKVYKGFPPDKLNKSGFLELKSDFLAAKGYPALPSWIPIPAHEQLADDELILTTYKVSVQTHSRSQNCKWLTELYHRNPALINPVTAAKLGIRDRRRIKVTSKIGTLDTRARVTEEVIPGVIAISNHCGHWAYGQYASLKKPTNQQADADPDLKRIWWRDNGAHPNWIIPNQPDPISGQLCFMDTVVKVERG